MRKKRNPFCNERREKLNENFIELMEQIFSFPLNVKASCSTYFQPVADSDLPENYVGKPEFQFIRDFPRTGLKHRRSMLKFVNL